MDNRSMNQNASDGCSHLAFNSGCGCNDASGIVITISPTTGGQFNLEVRQNDTIDHLKKIISKRLKATIFASMYFDTKEYLSCVIDDFFGIRSLPEICESLLVTHNGTEGFSLLCFIYVALKFRYRQLVNGSLQENDLTNGSRLTLLPIVESGLSTHRPEASVMNALESLNESQVNDFLSGKAPLNLTMRLGDHMMLIQLMLSTFSNQNNVPVIAAKSEESNSTSTKIRHESPTEKTIIASSNTRLEKILSSPAETEVPVENASKKLEIVRPGCSTNEPATVSRVSPPATSFPLSENSKIHSKEDVCSPSCSSSSCTSDGCVISSTYKVDSVPLAKATRNLTQTLQKLSSEVLTSKKVATVSEKYKGTSNTIMHYNRKTNAILENMEHHGRGIYSGTFSGTLNPALQDRFGRPKKDISTIIHILNDLLCAEPRIQRKSSCTCVSTSLEKMDDDDSHPISIVSSDSVFENGDISAVFDSSNAFPLSSGSYDVSLLNKQNENQTTKSKMEQLKTIMEERKEKRKEKRFSPYEKRYPSLNLITPTVNDDQTWSPSAGEQSPILPSQTNDTIDAESSTIHSKPVIA